MKLSPTEIYKNKTITFTVGKVTLSMLMIFVLYSQILACEPAVPWGQIALFPGALAKSLYLLIATIVLKCLVFAFLEKTLVWWKAILFLFTANIFSTIIGFFSVIPLTVPAFLPLFLLTYGFAILPGKGLSERYFSEKRKKLGTHLIALMLTVVSFASMIAFMAASNAIGSPQSYFIAKLIMVYLGLFFGIIITIFYEEWAVSKLARKKDEATPFLTSVTRANLIALLFMMILTAVIVIPERIQNQNF